MVRVADKELPRNFLQSFFAMREPVSPRSIKLRVAAVTGVRRIARNRVRKVGAQTHVLR